MEYKLAKQIYFVARKGLSIQLCDRKNMQNNIAYIQVWMVNSENETILIKADKDQHSLAFVIWSNNNNDNNAVYCAVQDLNERGKKNRDV